MKRILIQIVTKPILGSVGNIKWTQKMLRWYRKQASVTKTSPINSLIGVHRTSAFRSTTKAQLQKFAKMISAMGTWIAWTALSMPLLSANAIILKNASWRNASVNGITGFHAGGIQARRFVAGVARNIPFFSCIPPSVSIFGKLKRVIAFNLFIIWPIDSESVFIHWLRSTLQNYFRPQNALPDRSKQQLLIKYIIILSVCVSSFIVYPHLCFILLDYFCTSILTN